MRHDRFVSTVRRAPLAAAALLLCAPALRAQAIAPVRTDSASVAQARADSVRRPYTAADIAFMEGMIHHHAQALIMARMAPSHGASDAVKTLCARIINAQQDEIHFMQQWLLDRGQVVPTVTQSGEVRTPSSDGAMSRSMPGMDMSGAADHTLMPGMLTPAQLDTLDHARGPEFDRDFLRFMIQHHTGAVGMVTKLFATEGAGQDEVIFKLATDINVDQTTEINRMRKMLVEATLGISY
jgi:uncharacterized protein (DUF305 family)